MQRIVSHNSLLEMAVGGLLLGLLLGQLYILEEFIPGQLLLSGMQRIVSYNSLFEMAVSTKRLISGVL